MARHAIAVSLLFETIKKQAVKKFYKNIWLIKIKVRIFIM